MVDYCICINGRVRIISLFGVCLVEVWAFVIFYCRVVLMIFFKKMNMYGFIIRVDNVN